MLNLGVEGMMLVGAVSGFAVAAVTRDPWLAVAAAVVAGGGMAAGHAFLTVTLGADQVSAGLSLALFGAGLSAFLGKPFIGIPNPVPFRAAPVPGLSAVPLIGPVLFRQDLLVYLGYGLAAAAWWWIYRTRAGLHLRACGEDPAAADTMGIRVALTRCTAVAGGGGLAGLAGGYLSLAYTPAWTENMTGGLGWIAIALVIFATWNPLRLLGGAYLFGAVDALGFRVQLLGVQTSSILPSSSGRPACLGRWRSPISGRSKARWPVMDAYFNGVRKRIPDGFEEWLDPRVSVAVSIDMHRGHLEDSPDCPCPAPRARAIVEPINAFHRRCRALGVPIVHVKTVLRASGVDDTKG